MDPMGVEPMSGKMSGDDFFQAHVRLVRSLDRGAHKFQEPIPPQRS